MSTSSLTTKAITESPWAIAIGNYIQSHPVLWFSLFALMLVGSLLKLILSAVPQIDFLKSKILLPLVKKYKHKKLIKSAIKSDIRGHVNKEVAKVKKFLPCGWAEDMDIDWVDTEEASTLRNDKRIIVRIRPLENQEHNFVNASYHFLHSGFFPKMQSVIPKPHYEASVLYICRKVVDGRGKTASTIFEDNFLEPSIQKFQEIPEYMDDYELMDKRGFFMGTFLRELYAIATNAKFSRARNNIPEETTKMLAHVKNLLGLMIIICPGRKRWHPQIGGTAVQFQNMQFCLSHAQKARALTHI